MARYKGIFKAAANYEPQIAAPFDARMLVDAKADLTDKKTWQQSNGDIWIYSGMIVAVANDENSANNGVYMLLNSAHFEEETSWRKMSDDSSLAALNAAIEELQEQIKNIEISGDGGVSIEVDTMDDLPKVGKTDVTYYVKENLSIQRWNEATQSYLAFGGQGSAPDLDIKIIYGGNANVTD